MNCSKCKSRRVQRLDLYMKEHRDARKSNSGVVGCLFIIIVILVPVFALNVFALSVYAANYIWPVCLVLAAILMYVQHQTRKQRENTFICLVCAERFPPGGGASPSPAKASKDIPRRPLWGKK